MKIQSIQGVPVVKKPSGSHMSIPRVAASKAVVYTHGGPRIAHYTVAVKAIKLAVVAEPSVRARRPYSVPMYASAALVFFSFIFGVWFTWSTHNSQANTASAESQSSNYTTPGVMPIQSSVPLLAESDKVSEQNVLTMTMEQLENYLQVATTTPEKQAAETLRLRTSKLKTYLESKGSPLSLFAGTIAGLKHWRLVLAISNSESSLGRRCADNNCSGIGVMPGHRLWRTYETKAEWAKDLDKLIEKRYKNWSLEKMNGVYNQPGSENWVFAARQILGDLQGIE